MKIKRLTLAGFGPFKNEQSVDFERFDDDGIFLIAGKTGAGKSSILDAVCYALYNSVPRYEGTQQQLRSDHCELGDPTFVELEFSVNGADYKVRRSPEFDRPKKKNAAQTTRQVPTAELFVRTAGGGDSDRTNDWEGIAARLVDVAHELDRILGLSKDQFLQVILLAQNRFQEFLRSNNDERQAVLRTLFGTKRFEQIEVCLTDSRKALESRLTDARRAIAQQAELAANVLQLDAAPADPDLSWFESSLVELEERVEAASDRSRAADSAAAVADAYFRQLENTRIRQERRNSASGRLAILNGSHDAINADRMTLFAAQRATTVWPQVVARRDADAALVTATGAEARAVHVLLGECPHLAGSVTDGTPASAAALAAAIDETTRLLGTLESVLAAERLLPGLSAEIAESHQVFRQRDDAVALAIEGIEAIPAKIDAASELTLSAQVAASMKPEAVDRLERSVAARRGALTVVELEPEHGLALRREVEAQRAFASASSSLSRLTDERFRGSAADLASRLVDGDPCAVCGSTDHPAPARWDGEPVTEADIAEAKSAVDDGFIMSTSARTIAQGLATRIAAATAQCGNQSVATLTTVVEGARAKLGDATAAEIELGSLAVRQSALRADLSAAKAGLDGLRAARDLAAESLAAQRARYTTIVAQTEDQRAGESTVTARVEKLQRGLRAANAVSAAAFEALSRRRARESATAALTRQLLENDFITEENVVVARRPAEQVTGLEARIRHHDQAVATANATLAEGDLAGLPEETVDVTDAAEAVGLARSVRDTAYAERSSLDERAEQLLKVVESARQNHAASVRLLAEFDQLRELAAAVEGNPPNQKRMRLETYVLAAELEEIVEAANTRLRVMTSGRFTLEHDDGLQYRNVRSGLGLAILDGHTGRARATHSLSGGETFLASLALALGLAEVVTNRAGGITLDTLFIDEGFGSLDSETLEIALSTLDSLRAGGRTIGLISHVDTMKEQIPAKLIITVTDRGDSEISYGSETGLLHGGGVGGAESAAKPHHFE